MNELLTESANIRNNCYKAASAGGNSELAEPGIRFFAIFDLAAIFTPVPGQGTDKPEYSFMKGKNDNLVLRYAVATAGLFLVAAGIALSIISNFGTAPLSCPPYILNLRFRQISVGTFTWIFNLLYIFVQVALLRKDFKASHLMQIAASVVLGYFIDACLLMFSWIGAGSFGVKLLLCVAASVCTAFGISLEVAGDAWMLSAEMTVSAVVKVTGKNFGSVKVAVDSLVVVVSALLCAAFFGNPFGAGEIGGAMDVLMARTPGLMLGAGTVVLAVLPGLLMRFTQPLVERVMSRFAVFAPLLESRDR